MQKLLLFLIKTYLKSGLRGRTRFAIILAQLFSSLQNVPKEMPYQKTLYLDLRLVPTHSLLIGGIIEEPERDLMKKIVKSEMIVYDIGAYIGIHTTLLSFLVGEKGKVFAFEPQNHFLNSLQKTISELRNTTLFQYALSDKNEITQFYLAEEATMSSLSDWTGKGEKIEVETIKLDDLAKREKLPAPGFIKCDVEGAEIFCFRGGEKTIEASSPIIMFEINGKASESMGVSVYESINFLRNLKKIKYKFYEIRADSLIEFTESKVEFTNILALPENYSDLI